MKCNEDCKHWDKGECDALSTDLEDLPCLLRHVLWELEFMAGLIESEAEDEDGDEWKK